MKNYIHTLILTLLSLVIGFTYFSNQPINQSEKEYPSDWFFMQRAYPLGEISTEKYYQAIEETKQIKAIQGTNIAWHQGFWNYFHLYVKFLDPDYSLIVLTNSTTLGQFTSSEDVSVMRYPVVLAFYKLFIMDMYPGDSVDWDAEDAVIASQLQAAQAAGIGEIARQEIHDRYLTARVLNRPASARKALDTYIRFFTSTQLPGIESQSPFALIDRVGNTTYFIVEFTLEQETDVDLFAIGGYWLGQMVDYGDPRYGMIRAV